MAKSFLSVLVAVGLLGAGLGFAPARAQEKGIKSPAQWLGHPLGADRELADWDTIVRYSYYLSGESDRVDVVELGQSTLGKPFILVILGSTESVAERDHLQDLVHRLTEVSATSESQAREFAQKGKVIVALSLGLHAIEVGASQASMEMMYEFATRNDAKTRAILDNCLVLMVPSMNPDGLDIVADWYKKSVGTQAEGSPPPWLYHHYAGHDNNRDGFFNNLKETALWSRLLYEDWLPQVVLDEHQMGASGPRLFLPPFDDPISPSVHPLVYSQLSAAGQQMVSDLTAKGWTGIATSTMFTAEWPGSVRSTGFWHNMLGLLSEVASARIATPLYFAPGSLEGGGRGLPSYRKQANFLAPWSGGWWRLGDIITLENDLTWSLLAWTAREREQLLFNFYQMNADAVRRGRSEAPYGFVVGADQHDSGAAHRLARLLLDGGIELRWLAGPAEVGGRLYPHGAYLIDAAQPFRPFLMEMLDPPDYPLGGGSKDEAPPHPYDVTAWSLPALLDLRIESLARPLDFGRAAKVLRPQRPLVEKFQGPVRLPASDNASHVAVARLLARGVTVWRWIEPQDAAFDSTGGPRQGDFLLESGQEADAIFMACGARPSPLSALTLHPDELGSRAVTLHAPSLALYCPWGGSISEGWMRLVLDRGGFSYRSLRNQDFRALANRVDGGAALRASYDLIVLPSISPEVLSQGREEARGPALTRATWPEKYQGGLDDTGAAKLLEGFVREGGTLIALGAATRWTSHALELPVEPTLEFLSPEQFQAPGTLVRATLDPKQPLAWGMPPSVAVYLAAGEAFRPRAYTEKIDVPALYARQDLLVSGHLVGGEHLAGRPALVDLKLGKGRIVLFGFSPLYRAQTEATFKLLFNALLRAGEGTGASG